MAVLDIQKAEELVATGIELRERGCFLLDKAAEVSKDLARFLDEQAEEIEPNW